MFRTINFLNSSKFRFPKQFCRLFIALCSYVALYSIEIVLVKYNHVGIIHSPSHQPPQTLFIITVSGTRCFIIRILFNGKIFIHPCTIVSAGYDYFWNLLFVKYCSVSTHTLSGVINSKFYLLRQWLICLGTAYSMSYHTHNAIVLHVIFH